MVILILYIAHLLQAFGFIAYSMHPINYKQGRNNIYNVLLGYYYWKLDLFVRVKNAIMCLFF